MKWLIYAFFAAFIFGQLGSVSLGSGINLYLHDYFLVIIWAYLVYMWFIKKKLIKPYLMLPLLAFAGAGLVSLIVNISNLELPQWFLSSLYLGRWVAYTGIYWLVINNFKLRIHWLVSLYIAGVGMAVVGLGQFIFFPSLRQLVYLGWDPHLSRVFGSLFDPNYLGIILTLTILLGVELVASQAKKYRTLMGVSLITVVVALVLTYSRSSYLGLLAGFRYWAGRRGLRRWGVIAGLSFLVVIIFVPKLGGDTLRLDRWPSVMSRIGNWQESWQLIQAAPVLGLGFNTLKFTNPNIVSHEFIPSRAAGGLDSSLLFVWATTGFVGLASYIWLLVKSWGKGPNRWLWQGSLIAVLVHSLFLNSLFYPWVMIWLWVILGAVERQPETYF